jgi:hypothetical protein
MGLEDTGYSVEGQDEATPSNGAGFSKEGIQWEQRNSRTGPAKKFENNFITPWIGNCPHSKKDVCRASPHEWRSWAFERHSGSPVRRA